MSDKIATLDTFLAKATTILNQTERNLAELAEAALVEQDLSRADQDNGSAANHHPSAHLRLQKISQHLLRLSEQTKLLQKCLQDDLALPTNDDHWSQLRILQSQEEERTQLARELEDGVGQLLANTIFELASSRHLLGKDQDAVSEGLNALQNELEQGLTDVRHFIANLEPATILSNFGVTGGLRRYLEQYQVKTGLKTQLLIKTNIDRLPSLMETAIFRVIQEALSNVHRHAQATQVDVVVEECAGKLQFSVVDNGDGLVAEKFATHKKILGLARMVDYAELLNGELKVLSEPGQGTRVVLVVPYPVL